MIRSSSVKWVGSSINIIRSIVVYSVMDSELARSIKRVSFILVIILQLVRTRLLRLHEVESVHSIDDNVLKAQVFFALESAVMRG